MRVILNQLKGGREAFYDPARRYLILVNDLAEYSLWPDALAVPPGWQALRTGLGRQPAMAAVDRCTQIPRITTAIATPAVDAAEEIARRAAERPDATSTQWRSPPRHYSRQVCARGSAHAGQRTQQKVQLRGHRTSSPAVDADLHGRWAACRG
ncbi:MbtH family NRPS accessory protein [Streptomyces chattanoogensis]|uniref:MbtH family NRPS accessory protein n=1 Tax=Streptomyces chattanoogensis TaxID=66876 RepID=UPI00367E71FC